MEETISLKEIFDVVKKRLFLIISTTIGAAIIAGVISLFVLTPIYQSSSQFIVNQEQDKTENAQINQGTIRTNVELINTYNVIIKSRAILDDVIETLGLDYSAGQLESNVQVSSEQNSQVVTVTVKDPDPAVAVNIANTTVEIFQDKITDLMSVDNVKILSAAELKADPSPVSPNVKLNIAIAIVLGLMIGVGIAFLIEYLDTTIRTVEDVEDKLGVPVIGMISMMESKDIRAHNQMNQTNQQLGGERRAKA